MSDHDDDDLLTPEEKYGWREGEREQAEREMAEHQARTKRDEVLAWCRQRAANPTDALDDPRQRFDPNEVVTRDFGRPVTQPQTAAPDKEYWDKWKAFIIATVSKKFITDKMLGDVIKHIGETVGGWDLKVCEATKAAREEALAPLREEIKQLRAEVAELRAQSLRRSKPADPSEARRNAGALVRNEAVLARARAA